MARVNWERSAILELGKIDSEKRRRILKKISWLKENFELVVHNTLAENLAGCYKLRVGDYRVLYEMQNSTIIILKVGHRREVYD